MTASMQLLAALYIDDIDLREEPGPTTRIDLGGVQFSAPIPPTPFTWAPHLIVLLHAPAGHDGNTVLEALFTIADEQVARSVQPVQIEPGKFGYRLVRAEIEIAEPVTVEARVRLDQGALWPDYAENPRDVLEIEIYEHWLEPA